MGLGGVPFYITIATIDGLSELVQVPTPPQALAPPPAIDRRDTTSDPTVVSDVLGPNTTTVLWETPKSEDQLWFEKMFPGAVYNAPGSAEAPQPQPVPPEESTMGWFEDIYDTIDTGLGGWLPGGVPVGGLPPGLPPAGPPAYGTPPMLPMGSGPSQASAGASFPVPFTPGCAPDDPMKGYVLKKYCGTWRWIKQKSNRRKRLATRSDIRDIASLKGVLGNGKNLQAWIATHSN